MSVLARPQGLPDRVWSLVAGLSALGGRTDRATFEALINPGFTRDNVFIQTKTELARDTLGAASSLGLVDYDRNEAALKEGLELASADDLADYLHDHLSNLASGDTNAVMFEAYAWVAAESDRQGDLGWIYDWGRDEFADKANQALVGEDEDGHPMNQYKAVAWRRWLHFMGLGVPLPIAGTPDFPSPAARISRELARMDLPSDQEIPAGTFLAGLAERMPYLDGGRLFLQACQRMQHNPRPNTLSPLYSAALRDLHDNGTLVLRPRGDASGATKLTEDDSHLIQTFNLVIVPTAGVTE